VTHPASNMADEHQPLRGDGFSPIPDNIIATDEEEEEKSVFIHEQAPDIPPSIADSYQNNPSSLNQQSSRNKAIDDWDSDDGLHSETGDDSPRDFSHSPVLLCRITLFMYLFVIILVYNYFPPSPDVKAQYTGWFMFFLWIDIIACVVGMVGLFLTKPRLLYFCWVTLTVSMMLVGLIAVIYVADQGVNLDSDHGVGAEAKQRCLDWATDTSNPTYATPVWQTECLKQMKFQLSWTVGLLFVIYSVASGFGIHLIVHCEKYLYQRLVDEGEYEEEVFEDVSDLSDEFGDYQDLEDDEYDILMENKKTQ